MTMPGFDQATHLVQGDSASGHVKQRGYRRILVSRDDPIEGPCRPEPEAHEAARRAFFKPEDYFEPFGLEALRPAMAADRPVVIWATRAFQDLVWLWWFLDAMGRVEVNAPVWLARPEAPDGFADVGGCEPTGSVQSVLITERMVAAGSALWAKYADPSPLAFDEARRTPSAEFPELAVVGDVHGAWFPLAVTGKLVLSAVDRLLLAGLDGDMRRAADTVQWFTGDKAVFACFGGGMPEARLRAWAAHGSIDHRIEPADADHPYDYDVFAANETTARLLADGLRDVSEAAPIHVGGCLVNDPRSPWVRVVEAGGWHLAAG